MINPYKRIGNHWKEREFQFHIGMINPVIAFCIAVLSLAFQFHIGMINP